MSASTSSTSGSSTPIQAHITKVENEVGSEWYTIWTDHDDIKKLATKLQDRAAAAAELKKSGALAEIAYTERTKHDPETGRTYRNLYLDSAKPVEAAADDGIDQIAPSARRLMDPSEAWRICLATGSKLAVQTMAMMPEGQRTFEMQKRVAIAWAAFIYYTPVSDPTHAAVATATAPGADPDDDIPF